MAKWITAQTRRNSLQVNWLPRSHTSRWGTPYVRTAALRTSTTSATVCRAYNPLAMTVRAWSSRMVIKYRSKPSRVAKQLRLRLTDLKKQMAIPPAAPVPPMSLGVVEVPAAPAWPPPTGALQIELSRADGTRLCIHGAEATL